MVNIYEIFSSDPFSLMRLRGCSLLHLLLLFHFPLSSSELLHRYSFNENGGSTAFDTATYTGVSRKHGTLEYSSGSNSNLIIQNGVIDFIDTTGAITCPNNAITCPHVSLPDDIMEGKSSITVEWWFTTVGNQATNERVFQFGNTYGDNTNSIRVQRKSGADGYFRVGVSDRAYTDTGTIGTSAVPDFDTLTNSHGVFVVDGTAMYLYIDKVLIVSGTYAHPDYFRWRHISHEE